MRPAGQQPSRVAAAEAKVADMAGFALRGLLAQTWLGQTGPMDLMTGAASA